ncbi:MAG: hypothetical protein HXX15_11755 [Rhodopseudomonas sp.]|uniref:hypothetical protein n=1 Tax=Rhodopseudomonas sp. TaxID=1078 RepID=UPI0018079B59|nr:hypothetical protein [Rhodopseudomonas sp.]NVN86749.1 hypothetical protein [Rhodopseudomonas sp.]
MSTFAAKCTLAMAVAALCLGAQVARAQVAPVRYWIPGGPFGFGGGATETGSAEIYSNFPSFDAADGRGGDWRANFPTGLFVRGESGGIGLSGLGQAGAFGNVGSLSYQGALAGYNFKGAGDLPVTLYAGFDTLKTNPGIGGPLAPFSTDAGTAAGYSARAGIAFQPAPNFSLSFEAGYVQQQTGRLDSDINSPLLPGQSPIFIGGR